MYSFSRSASTGARMKRTKIGVYTMVIATTALLTPGPRIAVTPTASNSPGMLKNTSITRLIAWSHAPLA